MMLIPPKRGPGPNGLAQPKPLTLRRRHARLTKKTNSNTASCIQDQSNNAKSEVAVPKMTYYPSYVTPSMSIIANTTIYQYINLNCLLRTL
jgi:hypothetical protein